MSGNTSPTRSPPASPFASATAQDEGEPVHPLMSACASQASSRRGSARSDVLEGSSPRGSAASSSTSGPAAASPLLNLLQRPRGSGPVAQPATPKSNDAAGPGPLEQGATRAASTGAAAATGAAKSAGPAAEADRAARLEALAARADGLLKDLGWGRRAYRGLTLAGMAISLPCLLVIGPKAILVSLALSLVGLLVQAGLKWAHRDTFLALVAEERALGVQLPAVDKVSRFFGANVDTEAGLLRHTWRSLRHDFKRDNEIMGRPFAVLLKPLTDRLEAAKVRSKEKLAALKAERAADKAARAEAKRTKAEADAAAAAQVPPADAGQASSSS